ncbi:adenylate/guanylate cyclase domain-containing protein [Microvirga sp. 2MCAF38]|uniref:adenylate/guanylate cyclase domain-containing protein n=1 Tax=Microvirga sp. 2MCAF38 TaxID=3232989 RepID=UPI003F9530FB
MTNLEDWIIAQGLKGASVASLLEGFADGLVAEGIPVVRAYLALPTVNPTIRVLNHTWTRPTGTAVEAHSHERNVKAFAVSPFNHMLNSGIAARHWRLDEPETEWFEVFDDVLRAGGKDYLARLIAFDNASAPDLRGIAFSFSTDRPDGFTQDEIARIDAVLPLMGLATYRITLFDVTVAMLDTYVGLSAGRRVLGGEIQRGAGRTITAALLFADLRGFTALADISDARIVTRLDQHLEAMAEPVAEEGGEVLKFLGDGLLAAFPVTDGNPKDDACAGAFRAAQKALARNEAVNRANPDATPLNLDIALHYGDVFYGNVGSPKRLDFTVVGPAVNEVSRMETLCETLGCSLVMSEPVAEACPIEVRPLGRHALRGVKEERTLFGV